jgi:hypothetical protein
MTGTPAATTVVTFIVNRSRATHVVDADEERARTLGEGGLVPRSRYLSKSG